MNANRNHWYKLLLIALAGLVWVGRAYPAYATGISFRNETNSTVVVQGASIINGMVRRSKPLLILPGRFASDDNLPTGVRQITIYDPKRPSRILYRQNIPFTGVRQLFKIRVNTGPGPYPLMLAK